MKIKILKFRSLNMAWMALSLTLLSCGLLSIEPASQQSLEQDGFSNIAVNPLAVGDLVGHGLPDFTLGDADNEWVKLSELSKEQAVLILFYRGDWCPFCMDQLDTITAVLADLKTRGVKVVAISPDKKSAIQNTRRKFGQDFVFLSDPSLQVANSFGIKKSDKLSHPAVYLVAKGGELKWFYANQKYRQRPTGRQLLDVVDQRL